MVNAMIIFRTETKHFIRKAVNVAILTVITLLINDRYPSFLLWVIYLMLVMFCCGGLTNLLRSHLKLNEDILQGWISGEEVYLKWSEIHYARLEEEKPGKYWLVAATKVNTHAFDLRFLDGEAAWKEIEKRVPREALAEDAAERLVKIQEQAWEERVSARKGPFILPVGKRFVWMMVLGVVGWGVMGLVAPVVFTPQWALWAVVCLSVAVLLTLVFFLSLAHTLHITDEALTIRTITGHYQIKWRELEKVKADAGNSVVVFEGNGKRLVTAPYVLGGFQKEPGLENISLRLRRQQISITRQGRLITFPIASSKSARIKA